MQVVDAVGNGLWVFSEGSTGSYWTTYFLITNPESSDAHIYLRHRRTDGTFVQHYVSVPRRTRRTVLINDVAGMASAEFSTEVYSVGYPATPFVVERASYWPGGLSPLAAFGDDAALTPADATTAGQSPAGIIRPYGQPRSRARPPAFYHRVTEGEPAGPAERALAEAYRAAGDPTAPGDRPGGTPPSPPGATPQSSPGGWFGAHLTGGKRQ